MRVKGIEAQHLGFVGGLFTWDAEDFRIKDFLWQKSGLKASKATLFLHFLRQFHFGIQVRLPIRADIKWLAWSDPGSCSWYQDTRTRSLTGFEIAVRLGGVFERVALPDFDFYFTGEHDIEEIL